MTDGERREPAGAPLIVTATMDATAQHRFDALRRAHFPPDRLLVPAHITLFHQLPPSGRDELETLVRTLTAEAPPPEATVRGAYSLGQGVAFRIESPDLLAIRARIADRFHGMLTAQDRGTPRLHVTVQNKVTPAAARALLAILEPDFRRWPLSITGLAVHHYRGGPWEAAFARNFRGPRR